MLDFHGLFPSYVALFPGGVYMKIESLRLDLHLKRKQKKQQGQHQRFHQRRKKEKKKKKNPEKKVFIREEGKKKKKKTRDSRAATWVRRATNWVARRDLGLELISISSSSFLSFFFFFLSAFSSAGSAFWVTFWLIDVLFLG